MLKRLYSFLFACCRISCSSPGVNDVTARVIIARALGARYEHLGIPLRAVVDTEVCKSLEPPQYFAFCPTATAANSVQH
jgi:hypothetical protein